MNRQLLLTLGKVQVAAMFDRVEHGPAIDDSEFLPLVEAVLLAFETAGISKDVVNELWEYAFDVYDQACKEAEPDSTTEDNRQLMLSYLSGKRQRKR